MILGLILVSVVSVFILWIASIRQSRRLNLIHEWRVGGKKGDVFQGPAEWADINEAADNDVQRAHDEK